MAIKIGFFLDGTANHKANDKFIGNGSLTNVAQLSEAYDGEYIYEEGVGTRKLTLEEIAQVKTGDVSQASLYSKDSEGDFSVSNALKLRAAVDILGTNQVIAQADKAMGRFLKIIKSNPTADIELDIVGGSRGAAAERHLANDIDNLKEQYPNIKINHIVLLDTVATVGIANEDNCDLRLDLAPNVAEKLL